MGKNMNKRQCNRKNNYTWVDGYEKDDGTEVSGHCRRKK